MMFRNKLFTIIRSVCRVHRNTVAPKIRHITPVTIALITASCEESTEFDGVLEHEFLIRQATTVNVNAATQLLTVTLVAIQDTSERLRDALTKEICLVQQALEWGEGTPPQHWDQLVAVRGALCDLKHNLRTLFKNDGILIYKKLLLIIYNLVLAGHNSRVIAQDKETLFSFHSSILQVASLIKNNEQKKDESFDIEKKKRERKANYSRVETERLVDLIIPRKDILENKKNGANQWQEKKQAWEDIERDFNVKSDGSNYRDSKTLRLKYESLKRDIKKKWSSILAKRCDSDGKLPKFTAAEKKLKEIMQLPIEEGFCDFSTMNDKSDADDDDSSDSNPLETYRDSKWMQVKKEINDSDKEDTVGFDTKNVAIEFQPVIDGEPPNKRMHEDPLVGKQSPSNTRIDRYDNNIQEENLKAAKLQTELLKQEIELKILQKKIMQQELEHKQILHDLEKQHLLLKIEALKNFK